MCSTCVFIIFFFVKDFKNNFFRGNKIIFFVKYMNWSKLINLPPWLTATNLYTRPQPLFPLSKQYNTIHKSKKRDFGDSGGKDLLQNSPVDGLKEELVHIVFSVGYSARSYNESLNERDLWKHYGGNYIIILSVAVIN